MNNIYEEIDLQDCPCCGGAGLLTEEYGWCYNIICFDCGAQTAEIEFASDSYEDRLDAAKRAAYLWNIGKVVSPDPGE